MLKTSRLTRPRPQENLSAMRRRFQLSAALAVGGFLLAAACSKSSRDDGSVGGFGPAVARADEPKSPEPKSGKPATKHQNYTETLQGPQGKVTFEMIAVPGGEFQMGSSNAEVDRNEDEGPQVKVRVKPFWIGKCEVSWDEFDLYF